MASSNAYEVLGLSKSATSEEIKERFRILMLKNHPDKQLPGVSSSSSVSIETASSTTCEISSAEQIELLVQARNLLMDPELRSQLDTQLDASRYFESSGNKVNLSDFTLSPGNENASTSYKMMCRCGDYYEVSIPSSFCL